MTMSNTTQQADTEAQRSADIRPFPLYRTQAWRFIAEEHARRPDKGRYDKAAYAEKVITAHRKRLEHLGVAQHHVEAELARLEALFDGYSDVEKRRA